MQCDWVYRTVRINYTHTPFSLQHTTFIHAHRTYMYMHVYCIWNHCPALTPLLSCEVLPPFEIAWRTTRHPHPLEQIIVVDWIGVSPHRFPPLSSKDWSSDRNIRTFMLFKILARSSSLYSRYFIPLCLCDLSIRCFSIHSLCTFVITHLSSCLSWGRVQGVSWESFLSLLVLFKFWHCPTLHIRDFHVRYYRTPPFFIRSVQCLCVSWLCILCLYSVFLHPIRLDGSIFGGLYIFGVLYLFGGLFARLRPGSSWHFDTSCVKNGAIDL